MKKITNHIIQKLRFDDGSVILICKGDVEVKIEELPSKTKIVSQSETESVNISDIHNGNTELNVHSDTYKKISDFFTD